MVLGCCRGKHEPEPVELQVSRSTRGAKTRPKFAYAEYEASLNAAGGSAHGAKHAQAPEEGSVAHSFHGVGKGSVNSTAARSRPVPASAPPVATHAPLGLNGDERFTVNPAFRASARSNSSNDSVLSQASSSYGFGDDGGDGDSEGGQPEPGSRAPLQRSGSVYGFDEGDDVVVNDDGDGSAGSAAAVQRRGKGAAPKRANSFYGGFDDTEDDGQVVMRRGGSHGGDSHVRASVTSVDSVLLASLPRAPVDGMLVNDASVAPTAPHGRSVSPTPTPVTALFDGGSQIAGHGLESVVEFGSTASALPQRSSTRRSRGSRGSARAGSRRSASKSSSAYTAGAGAAAAAAGDGSAGRSTSIVTFSDVVYTPGHVNRRLFETWLAQRPDFDDDDAQAVRACLDTAASQFATLDTEAGGVGEVGLDLVIAAFLGSQPEPFEVEELRAQFAKADEDHSGALRCREFANLLLIREGYVVDGLVDESEPTLLADGSLRVPDSERYGDARGLRQLASACPGLFRKQRRGVVRVAIDAQKGRGGWSVNVTVVEAAHLVAPSTVLEATMVSASGGHMHHFVANHKPAQHPKLEKSWSWSMGEKAMDDGGAIELRFHRHRGSRKAPALGAVAFALADIVSDEVSTSGWFRLAPETLLGAAMGHMPSEPPGPSVGAIPLAPERLEAMQRADRLHVVVPPQSLLDLRLTRVLGTGNYGRVILATDHTGHSFAVKGLSKAAAVERDEVEQAMTEKHVLSNFRHPFVTHLFSTFQTPSHLYFCMEPLLGGSLVDIVPRGKPMTVRVATFYVAEVLLGLWFLHDCGVIYRDLKLENLLLDAHGHLRLADFGLAKVGDGDRQATASTLCGTPDYVAPEMLQGGEYDRSVDLWSLGVLLYRLRVGSFPFSTKDGEDPENIFGRVAANTGVSVPSHVDSATAEVIRGLLTRNHKARLGCHPQRGAEELRATRMFAKVDWQQLAYRGKKAPVHPKRASAGGQVVGGRSEALFDSEAVQGSPVVREHFSGFTWSQDEEREAVLGWKALR